MRFSNALGKTLQLVKKNSPEILTAFGVTGVVTTSYLAHKAATKVARDEDADPWASNKEKVIRYWKIYIPVAISGTITVACIVGSSKANGQRTAAAVTAYSITERAFSEYREKIVEQLGEGKEGRLRDELAQETVSKTSPGSKEVVITGSGHILCCELFTHRYFRSDMETLRKAQNDINMRIVHSFYVTLEEFYDLIGLPHTSNSANLGWDSEKLLELRFTTTLSESGEPCLAFEYNYTKPM